MAIPPFVSTFASANIFTARSKWVGARDIWGDIHLAVPDLCEHRRKLRTPLEASNTAKLSTKISGIQQVPVSRTQVVCIYFCIK